MGLVNALPCQAGHRVDRVSYVLARYRDEGVVQNPQGSLEMMLRYDYDQRTRSTVVFLAPPVCYRDFATALRNRPEVKIGQRDPKAACVIRWRSKGRPR